mmetsp:Transcript_28660/g.69864  ORF Transcript_28660/g.69864 Transcript_28660/m.69864 type:complete len:104 (-) Transcript_28660:636-947(-)
MAFAKSPKPSKRMRRAFDAKKGKNIEQAVINTGQEYQARYTATALVATIAAFRTDSTPERKTSMLSRKSGTSAKILSDMYHDNQNPSSMHIKADTNAINFALK